MGIKISGRNSISSLKILDGSLGKLSLFRFRYCDGVDIEEFRSNPQGRVKK